MTPSWRTVCLGLRLILIGAQTIGWSLAAAFAIGCGGSALLIATKWHDDAGWLVLALFFTTIGTCVLGRLLCAVGRWFCLVTPPEAIRARVRIRLTVIFETCSLLSGVAAVILAASGVSLSPEFGMLGVGFCLLTAVLSRVCFFAFALAVSEDVQARTIDDAKNVFRISLFTLVAIVLVPILLKLGNLIPGDVVAIQALRVCLFVVGGGLLFVAAGFLLFLFASHFILIADLRRLLAGYTPKPPEDDPDREYLERHLAAGGSLDDA